MEDGTAVFRACAYPELCEVRARTVQLISFHVSTSVDHLLVIAKPVRKLPEAVDTVDRGLNRGNSTLRLVVTH
jgi:hypothetical protein